MMLDASAGATGAAGADVIEGVLASDVMREAIATPRKVPRTIRERLAELVVREVIFGEDCVHKDPALTARRLGPLFFVFLAVRQTEEWAALRRIAFRSPSLAIICARNALSALLDAFEETAAQELASNASQAQIAFAWLVRDTMALWGRSMSARAPADRVRSFEDAAGAAELMSRLAQEQYRPRIRPFVEEIEESADAIEFLTLLYPGRLWDRGMADLHKENLGHIKRYAEIAARSGELQRVLDMLGRSETVPGPGKGVPGPCGRSELHSVANSRDIQYLLPSELVKLRDPTLKSLFMARWAEGKLLTYQLRGPARRGRGDGRQGPVVALVDTSGSMSGSPGLLAKAIVLAAVRTALNYGRGMRVVLFSSTGQSRTIDLSGERKMAAEFLEFLRQAFGGGTSFDAALGSGLDALKDIRYRSADLLFVTDGLSVISDDRLLAEWDRFRSSNGSRIYTLIIGNGSAGGLERISDLAYALEAGPGLAGSLKLTRL